MSAELSRRQHDVGQLGGWVSASLMLKPVDGCVRGHDARLAPGLVTKAARGRHDRVGPPRSVGGRHQRNRPYQSVLIRESGDRQCQTRRGGRHEGVFGTSRGPQGPPSPTSSTRYTTTSDLTVRRRERPCLKSSAQSPGRSRRTRQRRRGGQLVTCGWPASACADRNFRTATSIRVRSRSWCRPCSSRTRPGTAWRGDGTLSTRCSGRARAARGTVRRALRRWA
jgi:hypothetical protein